MAKPQCPNPACRHQFIKVIKHSVAIRPDNKRSSLYFADSRWWRMLFMPIIAMLGCAILIALNRGTVLAGLVGGFGLLAGAFVAVSYLTGYARLDRLQVIEYRCPHCGYCWALGDSPPDLVQRWIESELANCRRLEHVQKPAIQRYRAATLTSAIPLLLKHGDVQHAAAQGEESLKIQRDLNNARGIATALCNLGVVALYRGDYQQAVILSQESLALHRERKDWQSISYTLNNLSLGLIYQHQAEQAEPLLRESLVLKQQMQDRLGVVWALEGFAGLAHAAQQWARAAQLHGAAESLSVPSLPDVVPGEFVGQQQLMAEVRDRLGAAAFEAASARGGALSMDEAIEYALGSSGEVS